MYLTATSKTVSANELEKLISEENVKIFDLRGADDFKAGHIPGAMNISNKQFEDPDPTKVNGEIATPEQFEKLMSSYGIEADDLIVVYANASNPQMAPRLIWTLEVYGHTNTYVLDGHYQHWVYEGKSVKSGPAAANVPSVYKIASVNNKINVGKDAVINRSRKSKLIDVRPLEEYTGEEVSSSNARGGHIPGALNMYYMNAVDEDGFFQDPVYLEKLYRTIGVKSKDEIIVYCQRGHRASHTWFVLHHILGYKNVKVYDGSMMEWSNLPELPIVTGSKPK